MRKITKTVRGYSFDWYSEKELLEIFPEAREIIPLALAERREEYDRKVETIKELLTTARKEDPQNELVYEGLIQKFMVPSLLEIENHIFRLKRLLTLTEKRTGFSRKYENFEERRAIAKSYPITELARSRLELKQSGKNFVALCPLHSEKTPSFYLYTESNSFYCFGCQAGGDVITLTMHLYGLGFTDAVAMLNQDI